MCSDKVAIENMIIKININECFFTLNILIFLRNLSQAYQNYWQTNWNFIGLQNKVDVKSVSTLKVPADKNGDYSQNRARPEPWWCHLVRFWAKKVHIYFYFLRWGFSPWTPLSGERMLVIGAGDPRHLIRTLASQSDIEKVNKLEFFLWEQNAHVYCRQVNMLQTFHLLSMWFCRCCWCIC